jgi:hypothetical protein
MKLKIKKDHSAKKKTIVHACTYIYRKKTSKNKFDFFF